MRDDPYTLPGELLGRRGRPGIALIETKRLVGASTNIDHSAIFDRAKHNAGEAKITERRFTPPAAIWDTRQPVCF